MRKPHLTSQQKNFVIRAIACYQSDAFIVAMLQQRWMVKRSARSIANHYRHSARFSDQIAQCRAEWNTTCEDEPLGNRRKILDCLYQVFESAMQARDFQAALLTLELAARIIHLDST